MPGTGRRSRRMDVTSFQGVLRHDQVISRSSLFFDQRRFERKSTVKQLNAPVPVLPKHFIELWQNWIDIHRRRMCSASGQHLQVTDTAISEIENLGPFRFPEAVRFCQVQ